MALTAISYECHLLKIMYEAYAPDFPTNVCELQPWVTCKKITKKWLPDCFTHWELAGQDRLAKKP